MLARLKAWLHMRKVVPRSWRCRTCNPFCKHVQECIDDFYANREEVKNEIIERLDEVL